MAYLLLYGPALINIILIPKIGPEAVIFIPVSLLIGGILYAIYCDVKSSNAKKKGHNDEYRKYKNERDMTYLGIGANLWHMGKSTKDTLKDISDVDHWEKF